MKRLVPIFFSLLFSASLMAQLSIEVIPATLDHSLTTDFSQKGAEVLAHAFVVNTSQKSIALKWEWEVATKAFEDRWKFRICDNNQCYSPTTYSNIVKGALNAPVLLAPGDSTILDVNVKPNGKAGTCELNIYLSDMLSPNTAAEKATFNLTVNDDAATISSASRNSLRIFPNPTTQYISVSSNNFVEQLWVSNILGKRVMTFYTSFNGSYDISNLPDGIYLVSMVGANNKVLKTVRVSKRGIRP